MSRTERLLDVLQILRRQVTRLEVKAVRYPRGRAELLAEWRQSHGDDDGAQKGARAAVKN
jgi:hypothetical protein